MYVWIFEIWIFFETTSNEESLNMKVVAPEKLQNFVVYNFFIWDYIVNEIQICLSNLKFKFHKQPQMEKLPTLKL
jgi:hypothetical protein